VSESISQAPSNLAVMRTPSAAQPPGAPAGAAAPTAAAAPSPAAPSSRRRSYLRPALFGAVGLIALAVGIDKGYEWFVDGRFLVSTDDAYVGADTAILSPKVAGHVVEVAVVNNQPVHAGDLLVKIDDGDYRLAVEAAKAKIATQDATIERIGKQIEAQAASIEQAAAQVQAAQAQRDSAEADEERAALEYDRSAKLAQTSFGSQQRLEQATADKARTVAAHASAEAALASAQAALAGAKASLDVLKAQRIEAQRGRDELVSSEAMAERNLAFTEIRAPFDGVVGNKAVEIGQYTQPGQRLLALVSLAAPYVDANFKETQLPSIKPGQAVDVAVDGFGGDVVKGVVTSISPASGAEFSLLPPDNATGNFTKVVQRFAVRINFPADELKKGTLRPGLSVVATVRTRDGDQPIPAGALGVATEAKLAP